MRFSTFLLNPSSSGASDEATRARANKVDSTTSATSGIACGRCVPSVRSDRDASRVRVVSEVITFTVGVADCLPVRDLTAV